MITDFELLASNNFLVLDTETTGLADDDQVVEIAIIDSKDKTLMNARCCPTTSINEFALNVHGLSMSVLENEPQFPALYESLKEILKNKKVVIFNANFDVRLLIQTCKAFDLDYGFLDEIKYIDAMYLAANEYGATNKYGSISLENARKKAGVEWRGTAHTALADCKCTLDVTNKIAGL